MRSARVLALAGVFALTTVAFGYAATPKAPVMKYDTKPGPAFQTIDGTLHKIDGNIYVMEDYTGKEVRFYVSKDTKKIGGEKKPGDVVRVEVTKGWYANSIQ